MFAVACRVLVMLVVMVIQLRVVVAAVLMQRLHRNFEMVWVLVVVVVGAVWL